MDARAMVVRGRVQGVGFRWFAHREALALGIVGRIRNLADGTVEVHAVGEPEAMNRFRQVLHQGPSSAEVFEIEETPLSAEEASSYSEFHIIY